MNRLRFLFTAMLILFFVSDVSDARKRKKRKRKRGPSAAKTVKKEEKGDFIIEKRSDGTTVKYKKKTTYDFEGTDIEGLFKRPSGSYISNIKNVKGKSIIRIRKNFDAEVIDSSRQVK